MKHSLWEKRIPTLLGILLIGISIGTLTFLAQHRIIYLGNAAPSEVPKNVLITNISDTSFTVTYTTDANVLGVISYGVDKNTPETALDDRDQASGVPTQHTVHSITVQKLQSKTTYYFSIKSGDNTYLNNNLLYQTDTGPQINAPPTNEKPLTGKIVTADGSTPNEVLVFVESNNGQLLSTVAKPTGFYIIPLTTWRDKTLTSYINPPTSIEIQATEGSTIAHASFSLGDDNTVPLITLSKQYDFTQAAIPAATISAIPSLPGLPSVFSASSSGKETPIITTPTNNAGIVDAQPEIKGIAPPNSTIEITIHSSQVVTGNVTAASNGIWSFRPSSPLSPGLHTITVTIKDATGAIIKTIQQSFTVYAQGSQVDQSATPSATPTTGIISPTDTNTPTPSAITNTPTPTIGESPTESLITFTPTPTLLVFNVSETPGVTSPTPTPRLITGSESIPYIGIMGIITIVAGICIFFATQGSTL